jgi:hypothetical protein
MVRAILTHCVAALLLGVIAWATYANSFATDFVLDSRAIIVNAQRVHAATVNNLVQIISQDYWAPTWVSGAYRPVTTLSYLVNYAILGNADRPAGYHAINLALHWANALLVYLALRALSVRFTPSLFAAAFFTTHPVTTEAVTNIVGRADLLAAASVLLGLLFYIKAQHKAGRRKLLKLLTLALVTTFGLFCKETALVIVGVLILFDLTFNFEGLTSLAGCAARVAQFASRNWIVLALPLAVFWAARRWVYSSVAPAAVYFTESPLIATDFWTARLTAVKILGKYLWLLLWPQRLCCDYSVDQVPLFGWRLNSWEDWQALVALAVLTLIVLLAFALFRRRPLLSSSSASSSQPCCQPLTCSS